MTIWLVCRKDHPEALEDMSGSSAGPYLTKQFGVAVPPKTITTMQIYINEKCEEEQKKGSKVSGGKYVTIYTFVLIIISISITLTLSFQA